MLDLFTNHFTSVYQRLSSAPTKIGVAVSGGADSMALTLLLHQWVKKKGCSLRAVTVDHGLRPESKTEAEQVHQWMQQQGIVHDICTWSGASKNTQETARQGRYEVLEKWCQEHHIQVLCLAHHALDQAETIFLRFCKSSHMRGLRGMDAAQQKEGVWIVRPLLSFAPQDLRTFLQTQNQAWVEDPSNQNPKYLRTLARELLMNPESVLHTLGLTPEHLINWGAKMRSSYGYIYDQVRVCLDQHMCRESGRITIDKQAFVDLHPALKPHMWEIIFCDHLHQPYPPRWQSLLMLSERLLQGQDSTLGGCRFFMDKEKLHVVNEV